MWKTAINIYGKPCFETLPSECIYDDLHEKKADFEMIYFSFFDVKKDLCALNSIFDLCRKDLSPIKRMKSLVCIFKILLEETLVQKRTFGFLMSLKAPPLSQQNRVWSIFFIRPKCKAGVELFSTNWDGN